MIELQVEDYCHDCDGFDPVVENRFYEFSDNIKAQTVVCSNKRRCFQLMRYLERQYKKQEVDHGGE